ncbi:MAG: DUF819 family protein [Bacteroidales bacterium]|nr:DUF819 family protein [Bacteroidales bacterium]
MVWNILLVLVFLLAPAAVLWLCRRVRWVGKIGPVLILYLLGILLGNIGLVPGLSLPSGAAGIQDILSSAMVPIAIPLMLLGCTFKKSETRSQVLALFTGMIAVVLAVMAGYLVFGRTIDASASGADTAANIGGMLTGVYTGGTINLASLKSMLGVSEETFLLLNGYDMVISFLYLMFLVAIGIKLFRRFLPNETPHDESVSVAQEENPYKGLGTRSGLITLAKLIGIVAVVCGAAYGVTLLFPKAPFMTVFILALTTFGIAASFIPKVRALPYAYDVGMYCIYVFCIVVASMANLKNLNMQGGLAILGYLTLVIFGSLLLQVLFAKLLRIDSDTMVVSSVTFICSPPFVPMIAAAMKNRRVIVAGLSIGIIGYAVGNYLGFIISRLLALL